MIGFFGGSFDPIHLGHIALALELLEKNNLNEVIFCPASCSPFKSSAPPRVSDEHRLAMLTLALDHPQFKLSSIEIDRGGASYTIDTIRTLNLPSIRLILSKETATHLSDWKESKALIELAPPLIGSHKLDISSTEIRDRLKKNLYCSHLLPASVLNYIHKHQLYR